MCRYRLWLVCLLLALQSPLQAAVARAATPLPVLTAGIVEQDYSQQISLTVSGAAPFTYLLGGDDKPAGLLLDPQSGILHGSPTAAALGTHRLKVIVTDYNGKRTSKDFLLRVTHAKGEVTPSMSSGSKPPPAIPAPAPAPALPSNPSTPLPAAAAPSIPAPAPAAVKVTDRAADPPASDTKPPESLDANWGRVRAYFVGGILISNDSSSFSSAHQFYALNLDKTWKLPHCYLREMKGADRYQCTGEDGGKNLPPTRWRKFARLLDTPGISTYFETRLTSIPVVTNPTSTTGASTSNVVRADAGATDTTTNNFLTSQQTANVGVGMYLPFLLTRWDYKDNSNALFIAPIAKVGFNTLTAATSQTVVLPGNAGTGMATFEQIYNHYDYGFRVGHMGLTQHTNEAPDTYSYLDIGFGRFSNLQDLVCHRPDQGGAPSPTDTGCGVYHNLDYTWDSRKRLYRMDIEGLLKIPNTIFYVGLNANIGQKQVMAEKLDPAYTAPDDLRFLFGTRFDISQLLTRLGVNTK